jgi:hypothetical protein
VKAPLTFAWGNVLFGQGPDDAWAVYRVATDPYAGLTPQAKRDVLGAVASFAFSVAADFQILRVSRTWSVEDYRERAKLAVDPRHAHHGRLDDLLATHERHLARRDAVRPHVFVAIALGAARRDPGSLLRRQLASATAAIGLSDARGISRRELEDVLADEDRAYASARDFLDCERASTEELQWLIRRAFARGLGEPGLDALWHPQALVVDADDTAGGARFIPLEADVLRLYHHPIHVDPRALRIWNEGGDSHQAFLALGALPEVVAFPSRQAELLYAQLEAVSFAVDAVVSARWISNDEAVALARRKVIDADNVFDEEAHGDHGPTASAAARRRHATSRTT